MNKRIGVAEGARRSSLHYPCSSLHVTQYWVCAVGRKEKKQLAKNTHQMRVGRRGRSEKTACPTLVVDRTVTREQTRWVRPASILPVTLFNISHSWMLM